MFRSGIYQLGAAQIGEYISSSVDQSNMETIESQIYMYSQVSGDGVIEGWEVTAANNGLFQVYIASGKGKINNIFVETPNELQTDDPTVLTVFSNSTNYIYARLASATDPDIGGVSPDPSSYTKCVYFATTTDLGDIPSNTIRIANVVVGGVASNMTIDNSVKRDISMFSAKIRDLLEYYLLIHKHDAASPLYISKIVLTTQVTKSTTTTDNQNYVVTDGSWLDPADSFSEIPVSNSTVSIANMTDAQVETRLLELFSSIEVLVDNVVVDCYYKLDPKEGRIVFINPLPSGTDVRLRLNKNTSRIQVENQLEGFRLPMIDGSLISTGRLDSTVLPQLSHIGRVKEKLLPTGKYTCSTSDYLSYTASLSGHDYQKMTYVYSILAMGENIYLGTSMGLLKSEDTGVEYESIDLTDVLDSPIIKIIRDVSSDIALLLTYNKIAKIDLTDDGVSNITDNFFAEEVTFRDMAKSDYNNVFYVAANSGLFKTIDFGASWQFIALPDLVSREIYAITVTGTDVVYVSTKNFLLKSDDGGLSWTTITNFGTTFSITKKILSLFEGFILAATDDEAWVTRNDGVTWTKVTASSSYGNINNLFYDQNTGNIYILASNGIFLMEDSFAVTATQIYVTEVFSAFSEMSASGALFGVKSALLYNYTGANEDFFGFKSQFSRNRTPVVYVDNTIKSYGFFWYFVDNYKVIFLSEQTENTSVAIADSFIEYTPLNGAWDRNNIVFETVTYDRINYQVQGELDEDAQIFIMSSQFTDPIDSSKYVMDFITNTVTFIGAEETTAIGGVGEDDFIDASNISTQSIVGETGGSIYNLSNNDTDTQGFSASNVSVSSAQPSGTVFQTAATSSSFERAASEVITVVFTRIDVYKNDMLVSPDDYSKDYSTGRILFNEQQGVNDDLTISIYGTSIIDIGIRTHEEIDDLLAQYYIGMSKGLSDVYQNNLAHFIFALKHAIPYDMEGDKLEAYMKNVYYHSMDVNLDTEYDEFSSTLDKNISVEQEVLPNVFKSVYSILKSESNPRSFLLGTDNGIWETKDRGIFYNCLTEDKEIELVYAINQSLLTTMHAGSNDSLFKSIDFGETWQAESCDDNYNLPEVVYSVFTATDGKLYMGTNDGIFMHYGRNLTPTADQDEAGNAPWTQIGLSGKRVYSISENEEQDIIVAAEDGVYKYQSILFPGDFEVTEEYWAVLGLENTQCRVIYYDYLNDVLYVGVKDGLYYSTDDGTTFVAATVSDTIISIEKDYFGAVWFGGINTLYRLSPAAVLSQTAFQQVSSIDDSVFPIYAIERDDVTKGHVVVGSKKGLLFIADSTVNKLLLTADYLFIATSEGVFRLTLDGSRDWAHVTDSLTDAIYYDIITANQTNELIACADYGIIGSTDNGVTWTQHFTSPLPILQLAEVKNGEDVGIYAVTSEIIYKSVDNGHNWAAYLSVGDFATLSEFNYFFAELKYIA